MNKLEKISVAIQRENGDSIKSIDLNMLSILVGQNGSGKTMMLISTFFITEIGNLACLGLEGETLNEMASFIFKSTYNEKITGFIRGDFESSEITVFIKEGSVYSVKTENWKATNLRGVNYMSTNMRTFESISQYLFTKKLLSDKSEEEKFKILCENFRFYDVKYIENIIQKMPLKLNSTLKNSLSNFGIEEKIEIIDLDLEKCDFFYKVEDSDEKYYMKSKGSGFQSLLNMLIGNS